VISKTNIIFNELSSHGRPLHYTIVTKIIKDRHFEITDRAVYQILYRHPELFDRIDIGVYRARIMR
jgi:hypothetical protein